MTSVVPRVVLVTGAGGAIGSVIAERLGVDRSCSVCALDLDAKSAGEVVERIGGKGGHASAYVADLSDENSLKRICLSIASDHGGVDILVNNAAIGGVFPTDEFPEGS